MPPLFRKQPPRRRAGKRKKQILGPPLIPKYEEWRDEIILLIQKFNEIRNGQRRPRPVQTKRLRRIRQKTSKSIHRPKKH